MTHLTTVGCPRRIDDIVLRASTVDMWHPSVGDEGGYAVWRAQHLAYYAPEQAVLNADNYARYATAIWVGSRIGLPDAPCFGSECERHADARPLIDADLVVAGTDADMGSVDKWPVVVLALNTM
jgi:hypothetical protein